MLVAEAEGNNLGIKVINTNVPQLEIKLENRGLKKVRAALQGTYRRQKKYFVYITENN